MSDDTELIKHGATAVGAIAASFASVFATLLRPVTRRLDALEVLVKKTETAAEAARTKAEAAEKEAKQCATATSEIANNRREIDQLRQMVQDMQEQLRMSVTDEEFRSYTAQTGDKMERLLEAIGFIRGMLKRSGGRTNG